MEQTHAGTLIREWRTRRRLSQLDLAAEAEISQRHLSFVESGRARPSREMALHLADRLDMPLRHRNLLLLAAGYAPSFGERKLDDRAMEPALKAVELVLAAHEPNPAIAVDRQWNLVRGNRAIQPFLAGVTEARLLEPPLNVLRLSLHPKGLAPRIVNRAPWRAHLLHRLARQNENFGDPEMQALQAELRAYPGGVSKAPLRHVFGTPLDVTLSELAVESFFPADEATAIYLRAMALA